MTKKEIFILLDPKTLTDENPMPQPVHGIYKIDTLNNIELIIAYVRKPNGIIISPDQKTFVCFYIR